MKNKKQQAAILFTATTLAMSNVINNYALIHAQETSSPSITTTTSQTTNPIYAENGDLFINETTFPDMAFRSYINQVYASERNRLTQEEIADIRELSFKDYPTSHIHSLQGIAYFKNLTHLDCRYADISELDVSNNHELTYLDISHTPLKALELKNNTKLKELQAADTNLAYLHIPATLDADHIVMDTTSNIQIPSLTTQIDLTKLYPGLDPQYIHNVTGAKIKQGVLSNFSYEQPVVLTYENTLADQTIFPLTVILTIKEELAIDKLHFPNDSFRTYVKQFDKDQSLGLSQSELDAVTSIDVHDNNRIDNLEGVAYFPNLASLNCSGTAITSLDVSKNTALTELHCSNANLSSIQLDTNKQLKKLTCSNNPLLTHLKIDGATALEELECNSTIIETLDVKNNKNLKLLSCSFTLISSLDLANNTKLQFLDISYNDNLDAIDLSRQPNLEKVFIHNTKISHLDTSQLKNLTGLSISYTPIAELDVSANTALESLLSQATQIQGLDLRNNKNLTSLNTQFSPLTWIELGNEMSQLKWYQNAPAIVIDATTSSYIDLSQYPNLNIQNIQKDTLKGGRLEGAKLYYDDPETPVTYQYYAGSMDGIPQYLEVQLVIHESGVEINETNFPNEAFRNYVKTFDVNHSNTLSKEELDIVSNIDIKHHQDIDNLAGIEYFTNLEVFDCYDTAIPSLDLSNNTKLKYVDCSLNEHLTDLNLHGLDELEQLICYSTSIDTLDLSTNVNLSIFNGSDNRLTSLNLEQNTKLQALDLSLNEISQLDVSNLESLIVLDIHFTNIANLNIQHLTNLKRLSCSQTPLEELDVSANTNLIELSVQNTQIHGLDLQNNPNLTYLDTRITPLTWINLGKNNVSLKWNKNTQAISLDTNDSYIDLQKYPGLDIACIDKDSITNAKLKGHRLYYDHVDRAITYTYMAGSIDGIPQSLEVELIPTDIGVVINDTNFPDLAFLSYVKTFDTNSSGILSKDEIQAVTEIRVNDNTAISSLQGIGFFTNLRILDCSNSSIYSLDVSNNTALTTLLCYGNDNLETLDIRGAVSLDTLNCSVTSIKDLDLSNNVNLTYLDCGNTKLSSLDLTHNENLTYLSIMMSTENTLSKLDFSHQTKVESLSLTGTSISHLDLSPMKDLKDLFLSDMQIKELDVAANTKLESLYCLALNISGLDLQSNQNLQYLNTQYTALTYMNLGDHKDDLTWYKNDTLIPVDTTTSYIDLRQYPTLDIDKIDPNSIKGGRLEGYHLYYDKPETALTYTYDAGSINGTPQYMEVSLVPHELGIEINTANFPDPVLRVYMEAVIDKNHSAILTEDEVNNVTSIDLSNPAYTNTASLQGITFFPNIKQLILNHTSISSLDLHGLTSLETLDVSNITSLTTLNIQGTNLSHIDVTSNRNLTKLYADDMKNLEELRLEQNTALQELTCTNNPKITSLDLHNNKELTVLNIQGTNAAYINLGELDNVTIDHGQKETYATLVLDVSGPAFDITTMFPGIDVKQIASIDKAKLNGSIISGYSLNTPLTYTYMTGKDNSYTHHVTLQINVLEADRTISFTKDFDKTYDGNEITIHTDDIDMPGDKQLLSYHWQKFDGRAWQDIPSAPSHAGVYQVCAYAASDGFYKAVSSTPKKVILSQAANAWLKAPSLDAWTFGESANTSQGEAAYGDVIFTYSNALDGIYTTKKPTQPGTWYMKASVTASEDYTGLSEVISFQILPNDIIKNSSLPQNTNMAQWMSILASILGVTTLAAHRKQKKQK